MITREQLRKIHSANLPLHVFEQDYIQALFLHIIYKHSESLVFKGGTYLKHAYGLDRFSEDLDFTLIQPIPHLDKRFQQMADELSVFGVTATIDHINKKTISFNARLVYNGPLYTGSERSQGHIHLELSKRNDIIYDPEWTRLFFPYPELRVISVLGLRKEEVLAEKLRALSMRKKPRDLYDVWFLLNQNVPIDPVLFQKKMEIVHEPSVVSIAIGEKEWHRDLATLLEHPPSFEKVKTDVITKLKSSEISLDE
jgi:predicted nucleotidyltransferase component of viral defense system